MPKKDKAEKSVLRRKLTFASFIVLTSVVITNLLMLAASLAVADGKLPLEYKEYIVMLCVFLGSFLASLIAFAKEGRGVLKTAAAAFVIYIVFLLMLRMLYDTAQFITPQFLKNAICACAGMLFGSAVFAFRKPERKRKRRGYNKM